MPNRIIRDGILTSERIDQLSPNAELFYRRLMSVVDDYGRYSANPSLLRASCYPLRLDRVKEDLIMKYLAECVDAELVSHYTVVGKQYLEIQDFGQQIRSQKSRYPPPDEHLLISCVANATQTLSKRDQMHTLGVVEDVVVDEGGKNARKRATSTRKTGLPADFGISDRVKRWADEKGYRRLTEHLECFISSAKAKGYTYADWDEAFMQAIRKDWAGLKETPGAERAHQPKIYKAQAPPKDFGTKTAAARAGLKAAIKPTQGDQDGEEQGNLEQKAVSQHG